jgi:16S rRNA (cytidine1402-2'-O)-methyltransferase
MPGTLFVVATPIGNLEDITGRALRVLREVAVIAAEDTRRTSHLLSRYAIPTRTTSLHEHNETRKAPALLARLERGEDMALVSDAGTPTISDPGRRLIQAAVAREIRVESIPGPSAIIAALAVSGFPADVFTFMGFPPVRAKHRTEWFERLRHSSGTVVFFEAPHKLLGTLADLASIMGDRPIVVCRELTKLHEQLVRGQISDVVGRLQNPQGEFTIVLDVGQTQENEGRQEPGEAAIRTQFGQMIDIGDVSRREAVSILARRHNLRPNEVYRVIEAGKKSGE